MLSWQPQGIMLGGRGGGWWDRAETGEPWVWGLLSGVQGPRPAATYRWRLFCFDPAWWVWPSANEGILNHLDLQFLWQKQKGTFSWSKTETWSKDIYAFAMCKRQCRKDNLKVEMLQWIGHFNGLWKTTGNTIINLTLPRKPVAAMLEIFYACSMKTIFPLGVCQEPAGLFLSNMLIFPRNNSSKVMPISTIKRVTY